MTAIIGNGCGHDPHSPDLTITRPLKTGRGGVPQILIELITRFSKYYVNPLCIPSLNLANGSARQQRTERRESCLKLLATLIKYLDLTTMRVGIPTEDGFQCLTMPFLAKVSGMSLRRTERAMRDLKRAGLLSITERATVDDNGDWKGLAAVRCINERLFGLFGLKGRLKHERKRASKAHSEKLDRIAAEKGKNRAGLERIALMLKGDDPSRRKTRKNRFVSPADQEKINQTKHIMRIAFKQLHPNWNADMINKKVDSMI